MAKDEILEDGGVCIQFLGGNKKGVRPQERKQTPLSRQEKPVLHAIV